MLQVYCVNSLYLDEMQLSSCYVYIFLDAVPARKFKYETNLNLKMVKTIGI